MYTSSYTVETATFAAGAMAMWSIICLAIYVLQVIGMWKIFTKAGVAGWKSIIPIYNQIVLLQITGQNPLLVLLILVPGVGTLIVNILIAINLVKVFGKSTGFAVGLVLLPPIFYIILGFDNSKYNK